MTLDEAVTRLSDAIGFEVERVEGEPGTGRFAVEACDPKDWPFRLTVFVEVREKPSGGTESVIVELSMEPRSWFLTEAITKTTVRELPFGALIDIGAAQMASGPLGVAGVVARPALGTFPAVRSGPRGLDDSFFQRVAEVARFAARERQRLGRNNAPSVEAYVADKCGPTNSMNTAKGWLKQARRLGYLAPGELRNPDAYVRDVPDIADVPPELQFSTYIDDEDDQ